MTTPKTLAALALAAVLAACGSDRKADPYLAAIPDAAALTIDTSASASAVVTGVIDPLPVTTVGDDLAVVHRKAQALNDAVRAVFGRIEEIASSGGKELPNGVKVYGPAVRCVQPDGAGGCVTDGQASLRLVVRRHTDRVASFIVQARAAASASDADFKPVLAGYLLRGMMERRGAGRLWVNHENLKAAAPGFLGSGYLAAGFAAGPVAKAVTYRMLDFTRNATVHEPITAAFSAWKNGAGIVRARVAGVSATLAEGAGTELGVWRGVWAPALGGRAFTIVAEGDVPPGKFFFGRACYASGQAQPEFKEWYLCDRTELVNGTETPVGPRRCMVLDAGAPTRTVVIGAQSATWADTSCAAGDGAVPLADRDQVLPPRMGPGGPDDDRDEDGAAQVGLMPEPCPSTATSIPADPTPPGMTGGMGGMM